ncbi:M15 family metallopeptidase [Glaciecola sp. MF2-115]|uniref:M15 family metallopeptidase n=1 Tax=Glaciecola sp. MF2-115 TaxID=3384827 RepID=UPI0039A22A5F
MISPQQVLGLNNKHVVNVVNADNQHKLLPIVKDAYLDMQKAASLDGHDLQLVSTFRSFERQASIWNRKWNGELKLNTLDGEVLDTSVLDDETKLHAILLWSALPGGSRHHWGTDFDVYDRKRVEDCGKPFELVTSEYEGNGPCADLAVWLHNNASKFGFARPYFEYRGGVAPEPWHLSYIPIAKQIINSFSVDLLRQQLIESSILGLDTVLLQLNALFERYTLNKGM